MLYWALLSFVYPFWIVSSPWWTLVRHVNRGMETRDCRHGTQYFVLTRCASEHNLTYSNTFLRSSTVALFSVWSSRIKWTLWTKPWSICGDTMGYLLDWVFFRVPQGAGWAEPHWNLPLSPLTKDTNEKTRWAREPKSKTAHSTPFF